MTDKPDWIHGIRGGPEKQERFEALSQKEKLERLAGAKKTMAAETARRDRVARRALVDRAAPAADKDRGPWLMFGMTQEERVAIGIEGIEPVKIKTGSGHATVNCLRRRFLHPLDRYLHAGKLGDPHRHHARALHAAGMALHTDFVNAQALAKVSSGYTPRGSGGVQAYSDSRLAARKRMNQLFRGKQFPGGDVKVAPLLELMAGRIALHVCCLGEGTDSFDRAMIATRLRRWKKGTAMVYLLRALATLGPFYQARR